MSELTRKQQEIDDARDLLREVGAENFGTLREGIEQVLSAAKSLVDSANPIAGRTIKLMISVDDLNNIDCRVRASAARLAHDAAWRMHMPFLMEVQAAVLRLYEHATRSDSRDILEQVRHQLEDAMREELQRQRRQA